jgi:hypothetical protein
MGGGMGGVGMDVRDGVVGADSARPCDTWNSACVATLCENMDVHACAGILNLQRTSW